MTIKVLGGGVSPFVRKVRVVLEEKGVPYEHEQINPFQPPPDFRSLSPLGKIPVLVDDEQSVTLPDSSAICAYLERKFPQVGLYPSALKDFGRALWLEEYSDGGFVPVSGPGLFQAVVLKTIRGEEPDRERAQETIGKLFPFLDYFEEQIGDREFLVGDKLTIADIAVASPFVNIEHAGAVVPGDRWPALRGFLDRMFARESFAKCIAGESFFRRPIELSWD